MSVFQRASETIKYLMETLKNEFSDPEYRYAYAEDFLNTWVATQIRVLREQRGMTQQDLAEAIGTKQAGVSRVENVNYSAWKTETLRRDRKSVV
jgi:ribosome-binding protein aMBF1 (putative translation factor)